MLLRFGVENHRSIRRYQEISLVATSLREHRDSLIKARGQKWGVLPALALYGANASGKSNFLDAIGFMKRVILSSFSEGDARGGTPQVPFKLSAKDMASPSKYDCDFIVEDTRYHYGFRLDAKRIVEEWLFSFPRAVKTVLFHRAIANGEEQFSFGRSLKGRNRDLQQITRENSLFLSAAVQGNHEQLLPIHEFFANHVELRLTASAASPVFLASKELSSEENRVRLATHLAMADTGISAIRTQKGEEVDPQVKQALQTFLASIAENAGSPYELPERLEIQLGHLSEDESVRFLDYEEESLGTKYLLTILGPLLRALDHGRVLVLDEITTSLHTLLAQQLVRMFTSPITNKKGAQLIFSTHDTNLLRAELLRRDEVWFAEKDRSGASAIYPLSDIKTKNTDNLERGYIQGRYGAIPFIRNPDLELDAA